MRWLLSFGVMACAAAALVASAEPQAYRSAEEVKPLPVGASVPSVEVRSVTGEAVNLAERVRERGALLVFYRGGW